MNYKVNTQILTLLFSICIIFFLWISKFNLSRMQDEVKDKRDEMISQCTILLDKINNNSYIDTKDFYNVLTIYEFSEDSESYCPMHANTYSRNRKKIFKISL